MYPTNYFRWLRKDWHAPTRGLQQWWTERQAALSLLPPEFCTVGEWRDVPLTQE